MFACFERGFRERKVGFGCGGDDYDVDGRVGEHCFGGIVDFGCGVVFGGIVGGFGGSLDDGVEVEGGRYED